MTKTYFILRIEEEEEGGSSIYFIFGMGKATNKAITQLGVSYHGREGVECLFFHSDSF